MSIIVWIIILINVVITGLSLRDKKIGINIEGLYRQVEKLIYGNNVDRAIRICGSRDNYYLKIVKKFLLKFHSEMVDRENRFNMLISDIDDNINITSRLSNLALISGTLSSIAIIIFALTATSFATHVIVAFVIYLGTIGINSYVSKTHAENLIKLKRGLFELKELSRKINPGARK
jgi:hypothetical protein